MPFIHLPCITVVPVQMCVPEDRLVLLAEFRRRDAAKCAVGHWTLFRAHLQNLITDEGPGPDNRRNLQIIPTVGTSLQSSNNKTFEKNTVLLRQITTAGTSTWDSAVLNVRNEALLMMPTHIDGGECFIKKRHIWSVLTRPGEFIK